MTQGHSPTRSSTYWHDARMRLQRAPWWGHFLLLGGAFGLSQFLFNAFRDDRTVLASVVGALVSGVLFGLIMGTFSYAMSKRFLRAQGDISRGQLRAARRASTRGPLPSDPEVRAAAVRIADLQLRQLRWQRIWGPTVLVLVAAMCVFLAVTETLWWLLAAAAFAFLAIYIVWLPGRLRRRRALLTDERVSASEAE